MKEQDKIARQEREKERADEDSVEIYNRMIARLHEDDSNVQHHKKQPGWNMLSVISEISEGSWVPLAKAVQSGDVNLIGLIVYQAVLNEVMKEAKWEAYDKMEDGFYSDNKWERED